MNKGIIRNGRFFLHFGVLSRENFEISPIWCEYYSPFELNEIKDSGVCESWLVENLVKPLNEGNEAPFYSILGKVDYPNREFMSVFCRVEIDGYEFDGYVTIVAGNVNSLAIFLDDIVDLFSSELFWEENRESLKSLSAFVGVDSISSDHMRYTLKVPGESGLQNKGVFFFPVEGL